MQIKVLIADVDGTLVTRDKTLTDRTCAAVDHLREAGVAFTVTSGRPPRGLKKVVERLKLTSPVAAFNGGMYVQPDLTTVLAQRTIEEAVAHVAVDHLLQAGLDVWVYRGADWFLCHPDAPRVPRERRNVGFEPTVVRDLHTVLDGAIKIVGISEDRPLVARIEAELNALLGADASAARSQPYYLDITHPEANKGMVVRTAARLLGLSLDQVATIGDMPNDLPMLTLGRMSIAMGNASSDVQKVARHVTASNEEEGFARAVEEFILGEPPYARTSLGLPPRARACLFGLDGVLTQSARVHAEAWKQAFDHYLRERAHGSGESFIPFDAVFDYSRHFHNRPSLEAARSFLAARDIELPDKNLRALVARKGDLLVDLLRHEHVETYEGSLRYLRAAREAGLRTAVISASRHSDQAVEAAGLSGLFDARVDGVVSEAQELAGKPSPDAYLAAARAMGVAPEEAAIFEDELAGVEAGRAGHFAYVVGVDRRGHPDELREHGADIVVKDLAALLTDGAALAASP